MYSSGKPYPRLLPPMFLSPIEESEEEVPGLTTKLTMSENSIVELNNSSVIAKEISRTTSCSSKEDTRLDTSGRSQADKAYIESCSGRKHEDVEVVKQKYINIEIQDLPRFIRGPFRYGHIHRTRSTHLNLGSQDIRNQMNKIRIKARTSLTNVGTEKQQEYRCKKYSEANEKYLGIQKSVEEILYGDYYNNDDYDPELAALFENYIEECDSVTRSKTEPVKHFSPYPTDCSNKSNEDEERMSERQLELDTEHAFLCGYIEGLKQTGHPPDTHESEKCTQRNGLINEALPGVLSHRNFISSQQDITHQSLREWEHKYRLGQQQKESERQKFIKSLQCDKEHAKQHKDTQENNSVPTETVKPNLTHDEASNKGDFPTVEDQTGDAKETGKNRAVADHMMQGHNKVINTDRRQVFEVAEELSANPPLKECRGNKPSLASKLSSPVTRGKRLYDGGIETNFIANYPGNQGEEEESIVKLAKQKLEHNLLTSRALEETYINKLKARLITNDCKPQSPRNRRIEPHGTKTSIAKVEAKGKHIGTNILDELDGWKTKSKAFNDQDSVQVSSSELLHPIESFENIYSPMWTPSSSTPLFTPEDQKFAEERGNNISSPASKPETTSDTATSSDLANKSSGYKVHGNRSSKRGFGVSGDYKKAANLVKLRLTKSSHSVDTKGKPYVDKSFANVPLSQCANYNIEQNMRTGVQITTSINLSEKLAQQLKDLSCKSRRGILRHEDGMKREHPELGLLKQSPSTNSPSFVDNKFCRDVSEPSKVKFAEKSLPHVQTAATAESVPKTTPILRQKGQDHNVVESSQSESFDLPPISVRSFPARAPQKVGSKIVKTKEEDEGFHSNRGVAVRAGACTSPYMFDKEDPRILQLKARSLPPLHTVCTSCGGISGSQENDGKSERKVNPRGKDADHKAKLTHTRCCGSYVDDKWKLDRRKFNQNVEFPTVGVEKLESTRSKNVHQPEADSPIPQPVTSPTPVRHKCEEMSIKFMDKNIKFRFQCDVTVDNNEDKTDQTGSTTGEWLSSLSAPKSNERYQCPVTTETRIYKDDLRKGYKSRNTTPLAPVPSPYLDYCKYKAEMRAKRNEKTKDQIEFISDTRLTEDVFLRGKSRQFPVIPMKKRKDSLKAMHKYATNVTPTNECSPRKGSDIDLLVESTKPARLPIIKSDPFIFSRENVNNNGQTRNRLGYDIFGYSLEFGITTVLTV